MEPTILHNIPTYMIAGPLGAGKTTLLQQLLRQRPDHEHWAILINEFGQMGLDAALLTVDTQQGVSLAEIPGGCLCCVNGLPFQVGLQRLLKRSRPHRLLIETSGLGHPAALLDQLAQDPWAEVLALQPLIMVLDAAAMANGQALTDNQKDALPLAGCLILNKSANLDEDKRKQLAACMPEVPLYWAEHALISWHQLPGAASFVQPRAASENTETQPTGIGVIWRSRQEIHSQHQQQEDNYSLSWRLHPQQPLDRNLLQQWLNLTPWIRAKALIRGADGWYSLNALPGNGLNWNNVPAAVEQRIELIYDSPQDQLLMTTALRKTLITG